MRASVVVFFVAVPLCLGIALASGAPLFTGLVAGMVGGIVVGEVSGSPLGVSGPACTRAEFSRLPHCVGGRTSLLNKGRILQQLQLIPEHARVMIDGSESKVMDFDVLEILRDYRTNAAARHTAVDVRGLTLTPSAT